MRYVYAVICIISIFTNGETEAQTSLAHYSTASGVRSGFGAHGLKGMGYVFLTTQLVHLDIVSSASYISTALDPHITRAQFIPIIPNSAEELDHNIPGGSGFPEGRTYV